MKKTKTQKGITLIALIITIVVLMILSVVTINSVKDGGIITHAQNAATAYNKAQTDEMAALDKYADQITLSQPQIGEVKNQDGEALEVGEFIKYGEDIYAVLYNDATEGLQIVSTKLGENVTLTGIEGFENRIQILTDAARKYKGNVPGAIDARAPGYTFNQLKNNIKIINKRELIKNDGNAIEVKCYGVGQGSTSVEGQKFTIVLQSMLAAGEVTVNENYWYSTFVGSEITETLDVEYVDINKMEITPAPIIEYNKVTKVITAENSVTNKILPIFLLDQRIEVTGGSGTYADPYVYEF